MSSSVRHFVPNAVVQGHKQEAGLPAVDDASLVERIRRQDEAAFGMLYLRYARYLAGVVFHLLGADDEIDDVLQESFADAVEGIGSLRDASRLRWWLVTIAVRRVNRVLSSRKRRRSLASGFAVVAPRAHAPVGERPLLELQRALDALPPKLRVPWILSRVEQLDLADVASGCSISLATAKRRIAAGDERLRRWFDAR
jgi:RNA polymerase sigma-70 factor (ECF subfamily)